MAKEKFAIAILDMQSDIVEMRFVYKITGEIILVESEEQAEKIIAKMPFCEFYGLIPDPTNAFKALKKKEKK